MFSRRGGRYRRRRVFLDARDIDEGTELDCDVCVVGAGAAGITIARELDAAGVRTCLLESGGMRYEEGTQALYEGESVGDRYRVTESGPADVLRVSRLRFFGGSTNHWDGWCRELDELDFEARDGVPGSGWPIERAVLDGPYARARELCQLPAPSFEPAFWGRRTRTRPLRLGPLAANEVFQFSAPTRFGQAYGGDLRRSRRVRVVLHANAVGLAAAPSGGRIERVRVRTLDGRRFAVRGRQFVLASGGIENPRLLLASNDVRPHGIGNDRDQVGRCFADHPHGLVGLAALRSDLDLRFYGFSPAKGRPAMRGALATAPDHVRRQGLLRFTATVEPLDRGEPPPLRAEVGEMLGAIHGDARFGITSELFMRAEQAPNPDSRVTLSPRDRDPLGMPRVRVDWRLGRLDRESAVRSVEAVGRALGAAGAGRVFNLVRVNDAVWKGVHGADHHIGTTRMHDDPRRGVVDRHCRVHGVANLHVAGSSVFPTTGSANPTLTIVALAVRLAGRLRGALA